MKPKILSDEEIKEIGSPYIVPTNDEWAIKPDHEYWRIQRLLTAQLDADVAHYEPLIQQVKEETKRDMDFEWRNEKVPRIIQQAKSEVAREIFKEFLEHGVEAILHGEKWYEDLKSKYGGQK